MLGLKRRHLGFERRDLRVLGLQLSLEVRDLGGLRRRGVDACLDESRELLESQGFTEFGLGSVDDDLESRRHLREELLRFSSGSWYLGSGHQFADLLEQQGQLLGCLGSGRERRVLLVDCLLQEGGESLDQGGQLVARVDAASQSLQGD